MKKLPLYILLTAAAVVMIYPLLWLIGASFKSNDEIFSSAWFVPQSLDLSVYARAWRTVTPHTMGHYFVNTFLIIIPKTVFAVVLTIAAMFVMLFLLVLVMSLLQQIYIFIYTVYTELSYRARV